MSQQTTIRKLAELVNTPVEKLLEQLSEAGMSFSGPDQVVTSMEKVKLLGFLKRSHGKSDAATDEAAPKKITLNRRKVQEVTVAAGRSKTTVNVEVRQKRTYTKPTDAESVATNWQNEADPERAEILRKLEESRQRNLDEQQRLAQEDAKRAEELERRRQEEAAARAEAEAARAQADAEAAALAAGAVAVDGDETARPAKPATGPPRAQAGRAQGSAAHRRPQQCRRGQAQDPRFARDGGRRRGRRQHQPLRRPAAPFRGRSCPPWRLARQAQAAASP